VDLTDNKMKKNYLYIILVIYFIAGFDYMSNGLLAADRDSVIIKKCQDFEITGDGHSDQWDNTQWIKLSQPGTANPAYETKVKILYSGTGIYFLYSCGDRKLVSTMKSDNLNLWEEDVVEAFLWTDENFPVYFEYELSPYNYELPIMVPNNKGTFLGWLPWHYEGERKIRHATNIERADGKTVSGWTAEFFIPYKLLAPLSKVPPKAGTKWRANMYRIDYDDGQVPFAWQKTTGTFHEYNKFGTFIFE
jgi:hypothetical protein